MARACAKIVPRVLHSRVGAKVEGLRESIGLPILSRLEADWLMPSKAITYSGLRSRTRGELVQDVRAAPAATFCNHVFVS